MKDSIYKGIKDFCWIIRVSDIGYLKKYPRKKLDSIIKNVLSNGNNLILDGFLRSKEAQLIRERYKKVDEASRKVVRGFMLQLKSYDRRTNEKGVWILKHTDRFGEFLVNHDFYDVAKNYYMVLEPSYTGYCAPNILMFINNTREVIVQCPEKKDVEFIKSLNCNLIPIKLGSSHWVDLELFRPLNGVTKEYDIVYVAAWILLKKHRELFRALKILKTRGHKLKVLLIGYPWLGRTKENILKEVYGFGIHDMCTIVENIPPSEVNMYLNKSKASILLSRKEGSCKAIAESIAAGTPVMVYKFNQGGAINMVNKDTGILCDYDELPQAIIKMMQEYKKYKARRWAEDNIGYIKATELLNNTLKEIAKKKGEPWLRDILYKANTPYLRLRFPKNKQLAKRNAITQNV